VFFEILLLSVVVVTGYLGPMLVRRAPPGRRAYGWMLVADLLMAIVAYAALRSSEEVPFAELLGFLSIAGCVCLVFVPPMLRDLSRRMLMRDRLRLALFLIDARELLQPKMGAAQERDLVQAIIAVRSGDVDEAVGVLLATRDALRDSGARHQVDERIIMTYLYARCWADAIAHFEANLADQPEMVSPQLLVEMVRAYCEAGDVGAAAGLMEILEASPIATEPVASFLINRARMVFLAFLGRTGAVEAIVAPTGPLGILPEAARHFWAGIARMQAGDRSGAEASLERAAKLSGRDRRARELAEVTLSTLDQPGVLGPHAVPPQAAQLADRLTILAADAEAPPEILGKQPRLSGISWRSVPVTSALVAVNALVALGVTLFYQSSGDIGGLVRLGANVKTAVAAGEWWRLPASTFLHIGILHLVLNMLGLWILGRLLEQMYGPLRFFVVYMVAGIIGALASFAIGPPGMSAGASGAVFGVLGAAAAELALFRGAYEERWRRALFGNLIFLIIANVGIGLMYPAIDQMAHLGGLFSGAATAALISQHSRFAETRLVRGITNVLAAICAASVLFAAWGVATNDFGDTLARYQRTTRTLEGLTIEVPVHWETIQADDRTELIDRAPPIELWIGIDALPPTIKASDVDLDVVLDDLLGKQVKANVDGRRRASSKVIRPPSPWHSLELVGTAEGMGSAQRYRTLIFARLSGHEIWWARFIVPDALAPDMEAAIGRMLESIARER
jgi:rhomboid protease GluP